MVNQRCKLKLLVWSFEIVGLMVSNRWYQIAENYYSKLAISVYQGNFRMEIILYLKKNVDLK